METQLDTGPKECGQPDFFFFFTLLGEAQREQKQSQYLGTEARHVVRISSAPGSDSQRGAADGWGSSQTL